MSSRIVHRASVVITIGLEEYLLLVSVGGSAMIAIKTLLISQLLISTN